MKLEKRHWIISMQFLKAIEEKNTMMVNAILDSGFDVDINLMFCKNAISICAANGWYEMAHLLIKRGCSLSIKSDLGQQPLTVAVLKSDYRLVQLLVDNRADRTCLDLQGKSALHYACELNNLRIVQLLTAGACKELINKKGHNRQTPLAIACKHSCVAVVEHLLSRGADVNALDTYHSTPLFGTVTNMHCCPRMVELLLNAGADIHHVNLNSDTVLHCALSAFSRSPSLYQQQPRLRDTLHFFINCGLPASSCDWDRVLHLAIQLEDVNIVRKLLNTGCNVSTTDRVGMTPLFYACGITDPEIAFMLLDCGAKVEETERWRRARPHAMLEMVQERGRTLRPLAVLCRRVIRNGLAPEVEKRATGLPLPKKIIDYVLLM